MDLNTNLEGQNNFKNTGETHIANIDFFELLYFRRIKMGSFFTCKMCAIFFSLNYFKVILQDTRPCLSNKLCGIGYFVYIYTTVCIYII